MKFILLILFFLFPFYYSNSVKTVEFTIPINNLTVILRQDLSTQLVGAALLVEAGSSYEPRNLSGLAHLLEHMLFYSSKKYPKESYFKELIGQYNGRSNAFTTDILTLYYFELGIEKDEIFDLILDVFSRFFIDPNFSDENVRREVQAVNNEYENDLISNSWRFQELLRNLAFINSPFNHFMIGNKNSLPLEDENQISLTKHLRDFYNNFYVANNMKLLIYGNRNIDELKKLAIDKFSSIKTNKNINIPFHIKYPKLAFPKKSLGKLIYYKPIGNIRMVGIVFPIQELSILKGFEGNRMIEFIHKLLNLKTKYSLFSVLRKKKFATSLDISFYERYFNLNLFIIKISLTNKGESNIEKVLNIVFQAIKTLSKLKITKKIFEKFILKNFLNFMYPEKSVFHENLINILMKVREGSGFDKVDEVKELTYFDFDKKLFKKILKNFVLKKSLVVFASEQYQIQFGNRFKFRKNKPELFSSKIINDFSLDQPKLDGIHTILSAEKTENSIALQRFYISESFKPSLMSSKYLNLYDPIMKIHYTMERIPLKLKNKINENNKIKFKFSFSNKYLPSKFKIASNCPFKQVEYLMSKIKKSEFLEIDPKDNFNLWSNYLKNSSNKVKLLNSRIFSSECLLKEQFLNIKNRLKLIYSNNRTNIFLKTDYSNFIPKVYIRISLIPKTLINNPFTNIYRIILLAIYEDQNFDLIAQIREAGYEFTLDLSSNGLELILYGFSHNIEIFTLEILQKIKKSVCKKNKFIFVKNSIFRQLNNQEKISKHIILNQYFSRIIDQESFLVEELIVSINKIKYIDFKNYLKIFFKESFITILLLGNIEKKNSINFSSKIKQMFKLEKTLNKIKNNNKKNSHFDLLLKNGTKELIINELSKSDLDKNHAILNIYTIPKIEGYENAINYIYSKLNSAAFYWLRTQKQLGYIVHSRPFSTGKTVGISILVQGTKKNPKEMDNEIEMFLSNFLKNFKNENSINKSKSIKKNESKNKNNKTQTFSMLTIKEKGIKAWNRIEQIITLTNYINKMMKEKKIGKITKSKNFLKKPSNKNYTKKLDIVDFAKKLFEIQSRNKISIRLFSNFENKKFELIGSEIEKLKYKKIVNSVLKAGNYLLEK